MLLFSNIELVLYLITVDRSIKSAADVSDKITTIAADPPIKEANR